MEQVNRSELRKMIMTILYQISIYKQSGIPYDVLSVIKGVCSIDNLFVNSVVNGVLDNIDEIDSIANSVLNGWTIDRLGNTDQAILRMAIYELIYSDTPSVVAINEAVLLAKAYSDDDVRKMINASLDKLYHERVDNE